jgi:bacillithiol system protein YtxJ
MGQISQNTTKKKEISGITDMIKWNSLSSPEQLSTIIEESQNQPVLIFKHSTRCSISAASLDRIQRKWDDQQMSGWKPYYLDLIANRPVSQAVADTFGIEHESPQAIVVFQGKPVYDASHFSISYDDIKASAGAAVS